MIESQRHRSELVQRPRIEIAAGAYHLIVNPPFLHVAVTQPSKETFECLGPPRFFNGERAQHLTIPLEPLQHGPNVGKYNVHLTYGAGGKSRRRTVALLAPTDLEQTFLPIAKALHQYALRAMRPVTIEGLRREGYVALLMSEHATRWADERMLSPRWKLRVTESKFMRALQEYEVYEVDILDDLRDHIDQESVMVVGPKQDLLAVNFRQEPWGPDHPRGWYVMRVEQDGFKSIIENEFFARLGQPFFDALIDIARELQADIDAEALLRARERAPRSSVRPTEQPVR